MWVAADCPDVPAVTGVRWYVSPEGLDTASGAEGAPFASVSRAAQAANAGDVIYLAAGDYVEASTVVLKSGVALVGAGEDTTSLAVGSGESVLRIDNAASSQVSHLQLQGGAAATNKGLVVAGAAGLTVAHVVFSKFGRSALVLERGAGGLKQVLVCRSQFSACAAVDPNHQPFTDTSCIESAPLANSRFSDLRIDEAKGAGMAIQGDPNGADVLSNVALLGLQINVNDFRGGTFAPQYTLAIRNVDYDNVVIDYGRFNQPVALWQQTDSFKQVVEVKHTVFIPRSFALELDVNNVEVHHNYIEGGYYALFGANAGGPLKGVRVHHNIFAEQRAPTLLVQFSRVVSPFDFYNNTVHLSGDTGISPLFRMANGSAEHHVHNNIFFSTGANVGDVLGLDAAADVTSNIFSNIDAPAFPSNLFVAPALALTGKLPEQYYRPSPGSPAIGAGVAVPGPTPAGADLGACDHAAASCLGVVPP